MKGKVIDNLCIGCGACAALVPEEFDLTDEGIAKALNEKINEENLELANEAKENCPTSAIVIEEI